MKTKKKSLQIINNIKLLIAKKNLLQSNESLVLAISGGQDSIFLLIFCFVLKNQWTFKLNIVYCNHLWNQNALYSFLHISKISTCLSLTFFYSITLKKLTTEEESRYWRSKNYYRFQQFSNSSILLTGHTLTDQIETFFFNTTRGSSFSGSSSLRIKKIFNNKEKNNFPLCQYELIKFKRIKRVIFVKEIEKKNSIKNRLPIRKNFYKNDKKEVSIYSKKNFFFIEKKLSSVKVIRPLITKTRFDIKNICQIWKLPLFVDQTNEETKYSRNRLRKQILPIFRFFFNSKVDLNLNRHNEIFLEDDEYIEKLIIKLLHILVNEDKNGYFFNISLFSSLPISLQRRICLLFFKEKLKLNYNFLVIESFILFTRKFQQLLKKEKNFNSYKNKFLWIFFPEIGILYLSKTLYIFLK